MKRISRKSLLVAAAVFGAAMLAGPGPALAHDGHGRYERRYDRRDERHRSPVQSRWNHRDYRRDDYYYERRSSGYQRWYPRRDGHRAIAIPRVLVRSERYRYNPYYWGNAYYRPHNHSHHVYVFPVWTGRGWIEEPHFYCDDHLFHVSLSTRDLEIHFGH